MILDFGDGIDFYWDSKVSMNCTDGFHAQHHLARVEPLLDGLAGWTSRELVIIVNYDPRDELKPVYLEASIGTRVYVWKDSRSPPNLGSMFSCDYVYAHRGFSNCDDDAGWLPLSILERQAEKEFYRFQRY